MKKLIFSIALAAFLFTSHSCNKQVVESPIPNVPFDITLNLTLPLYSDLLHPMAGIVFINGGSRGIAILRTGPEQFVVFDRHCPHQVEQGHSVVSNPDNSAGLWDEDGCGSEFNMLNAGLPDKGPAVTALKTYNYTYNGTNLRVYN